MSNPEDFFYDAPITVYKGPSLYLFAKDHVSEYQDSLKSYVFDHIEQLQSPEFGQSSSASKVNPKTLKVKWKHQDELTIPAFPFDGQSERRHEVTYEADMVFIKLSAARIQRFCLLTRRHVHNGSSEGAQQQPTRPFSRKEYLTQKVVLFANASTEIEALFIDFLSKSFDSLFKPIVPLSTRFMLAQYDRIFDTLRKKVSEGKISSDRLKEETSYISFDVSATLAAIQARQRQAASSVNKKRIMGYGTSYHIDLNQENHNFIEDALEDITVSIRGQDITKYFEWIEEEEEEKPQSEKRSHSPAQLSLSTAVIRHYFESTGINLSRLQISGIITSALTLTAKGKFRILKRGFYGNEDQGEDIWMFINAIAEQ